MLTAHTAITMEDAINTKLVDMHLKFQLLEETYKKHIHETRTMLEEYNRELSRIEGEIQNNNLSRAELNAHTTMKNTISKRISRHQELLSQHIERKQNLDRDKEKLLSGFFKKNRAVFVRENSLEKMVSFVKNIF